MNKNLPFIQKKKELEVVASIRVVLVLSTHLDMNLMSS